MTNFKKNEVAVMDVKHIWNEKVKPELNNTYGSLDRQTTSSDYPDDVRKLEADICTAYTSVKIEMRRNKDDSITSMQELVKIANRVLTGLDKVPVLFSNETWFSKGVEVALKQIKEIVTTQRDEMDKQIQLKLGNSNAATTKIAPKFS